jgi:hypothetical protein
VPPHAVEPARARQAAVNRQATFRQGTDLNQPVRCNRAEFLKALGWQPGKKTGAFGKSAYDWLDQSFQRLSA